MQKVHIAPLWSILAGAVGLAVIGWFSALSVVGWCAGLLYLVCSNVLLTRGLRRHGTLHFGPANAVTAARSTLVGLVTALVATSFTASVSVPLLVGLTAVALVGDAVDGWIARRTQTASALGARFDMEVDAFLILVLSAYVAQSLGWWVLAIGGMRYAFVAVGWVLPWMTATLPPRYWRKVVAALVGIGMTVVASGLMPVWADIVLTLAALGLLVESFGRDVIWLFRRRAERVDPVVAEQREHEDRSL
ncbi:Phosphatidylglycerophosphate synthase [Microbacterium sp. cf046]|uniref:CDP-alcohol phosphatidyltransferase family protein n=1 Tax=Microbacterium sp. cf046 TaxID=1761803 RepID=UPI0008EEFD16|nr:CDP-alcohol phosphatidyltransferase family protein [Microbacterium sp. cf046]SFS14691.1 Phosphatidylglycerophosphate synthase [Microbacterium sp. cf046]